MHLEQGQPQGTTLMHPARPIQVPTLGISYTSTVNVEIFAQDIFSRISRRASDARKFGVSENYNHNRTNRNKQNMHENLTAQICLIGLDVRKFSCAKISTFTVVIFPQFSYHKGKKKLTVFLLMDLMD